ncbi:hypothetical protein HPB49_008075 [Dermacentor silvarum]|uniref:Uncharacterized protein n=1 Tax=Dermacentor silvarum TaxID=543639 RepID=A0ACB8CQK9_DERSI|nr:hypothetical protein HPB49_008075 [Dermacentor silvarum]
MTLSNFTALFRFDHAAGGAHPKDYHLLGGSGSRPLGRRKRTIIMEYTVVGEELSPEDFSEDASWRIYDQRRGSSDGAIPKALPSVAPGHNVGRAGASVKNHITRRGRMPPLPREDIKVENATKYVRIKNILVAERMHEVAACRTAPYATCKGVIRDITRCYRPEVLQRKIVNSRNPLVLAAKRIKDTGGEGLDIVPIFNSSTLNSLLPRDGVTDPDRDPEGAAVHPGAVPEDGPSQDPFPGSASNPEAYPYPGPGLDLMGTNDSNSSSWDSSINRRPPIKGAVSPGLIGSVEDH